MAPGSTWMRSGESALSARLARAEWWALAFAVLVAHGFLVHEWFYPSQYDAVQYAQMGREIAAWGLFGPVSATEMRTYGYPLFLSLVYRGAAALGMPFAIAVFELQLVFYLAACLLFRNALLRISPLAGRIAFVGLLLNFYVLVYTPETLTESVSVSLLLLAGACWLAAARAGGLLPLVLGSLVVGGAVMVRPANLFMAAAWLVGVVIIGVRQRPAAARAFAATVCVAVALALPALPQLANNVTRHGKWTPFVVLDLGTMQQIWGIRDLKYATALPPATKVTIHYVNPLWPGTTVDDDAPWRWYGEYPLRGAATLALHTFNLTDQDLLFTYSRDLDPWYRVPLGVINHSAVALGLIGLVLLARRVFGGGSPEERGACTVLFVMATANWAMYVWTGVEMRFGVVLLLVLFPLAGYAGIRIAGTGNVRTTAAVALGVALYVTLALLLSGWVRDQASAIRNAGAVDLSPADALIGTATAARGIAALR